ncbi:carbonic anhydrase 1 [Caerostris darwini]|uniref:Carbonic anhydrase n=1 Tax=Caerostris darwini TaxID=1538125 RepID=A0AAV4P950_9ARAC|nr:carbonic anhydrase 1 [Caerostris darwini]
MQRLKKKVFFEFFQNNCTTQLLPTLAFEAQGPDTWASKYPHAGGQNQSPVDIVTSSVQPKQFESPVSWRYGPGICKTILNTGCGWRVDVQGNDSELSGGPLTNSYELVQFHSHWGDDHSCGSEHTVDGKAYAGELHFVHWNREKFPSCADAVPSPTGLTVIAVFLEVGEENSEIEKLCQVLSKIPTKDERTDLPSDLDPVAMFPADAATSYWTYSGSLTTPPCYESVTWIVFKQPITVSQEQLNYFRQMKKPCAEDSFVLKNYRPPQSLNDREIFECA